MTSIDQLRLKSPCRNCPFRTDILPFLESARAQDLARMLGDNGGTHFVCHKTVEYNNDDGGKITPDTKVCAGAMILAAREGRTSQIQQVGQRLGLWSPDELDMAAPVYASFKDFIDAHRR